MSRAEENSARWLATWVEHWKKTDDRRLYSSGAGWPQIAENQFHVTPDPRIQAWGSGLGSRINARAPETVTDYRDYIRQRPVPVISHEIGQWCVYPNFDEIPKYTGYLKPRNFEIFRETLRRNHLGDQAGEFLRASGKLQTLCYKEDIESALRTPGMGGFQLLDLHDFPGTYDEDLNRYSIKSPGYFGAVSKNFDFLGYMSLHGTVNYSLEGNDGDNFVDVRTGVEKTLGSSFSLIVEYDFAFNDDNTDFASGKGYLNAGLRWSIGTGFTLGFDLRDLLSNKSSTKNAADRSFKIEYITNIF